MSDTRDAGSWREEEQNLLMAENYEELGAADHIHILVGSGVY